MSLIDSVPWQAEVVDAPPFRLDYGDIDVPSDLDFTHIAVRHDLDGEEPDYIEEVLEDADVLVQEQAGWTKEYTRMLQGVSDGSYTALKAALEEMERQKLRDPRIFGWHELVFRQMYGSHVRVVMADYPSGHPALPKLERAINSGKESEEHYRLFAERDKFMTGAICAKIAELRGAVPDIAAKRPLRAVALLGAGHYAVHDALAAAASEHGVPSFSSRLLFEASASMTTSKLGYTDAEALSRARHRMVDYQNWLRTPED